MKKAFVLLVLAATFSSFAQAQTAADSTQNRKPRAGNFTTELTLSLFTHNYYNYYNGGYGYQNDIFSLGNILSQIRGRYFFQDDKAWRLSFNIEHHTSDINNTYVNNYESLRRNTVFSISPGYEKHFKGTSRLSPYIGTELAFVAGRFHEKFTNDVTNDRVDIEKGWLNYNSNNFDSNIIYTRSDIGARNFTTIGLHGLAGLDYYVMKRFYLGLELGYSLSYTKTHDVKIVQKEFKTEQKIKGHSSWNSGAYANSGIRAGFVF